jgi:hypothetical protein
MPEARVAGDTLATCLLAQRPKLGTHGVSGNPDFRGRVCERPGYFFSHIANRNYRICVFVVYSEKRCGTRFAPTMSSNACHALVAYLTTRGTLTMDLRNPPLGQRTYCI